MSQPHFEGVLRSPLTLLKMGLGSPLGLPKTQSVIAGVKTPRIEAFFIPLERSWSVNVQNGLAWAIWTSVAQGMVERRAGSPNRDSFGTPLWESREKEPFGCKCGGELQRILYGGRWWLPLNPGRGESSESKVARGLSQHQKGCRMSSNQLVGWIWMQDRIIE